MAAHLDLPKRTKQQKSEAHSYAVLLYKLRDLGIFRNLTENDYGIDFELEIISGDQVTARLVKIQVKSAEKLKLRKDGTPSVGGIKQSTLAYWCELSHRTNVIAYAVDLDTETIYVSSGLFWQATKAIDGSGSTKSITFIKAGKDKDLTTKAATLMWAYAPTAADHVSAHSLALRRLPSFVELLADAFHYDPGTDIDATLFKELLEVSSVLLWVHGASLWMDEQDQRNWLNFDYWHMKSERDGWDGISCFFAQAVLSKIVPALVDTLVRFRKIVLDGKYYWSYKNPQFLGLVYEATLPEKYDLEALTQWKERIRQGSPTRDPANYFVAQARLAKPPTPRKNKTDKKAETSSR